MVLTKYKDAAEVAALKAELAALKGEPTGTGTSGATVTAASGKRTTMTITSTAPGVAEAPGSS